MEGLKFQRVFVEELGQEVLMDPQGNLFDLNGNFIGQADNQEEIDDDSEDDVYFDGPKE